jgi:hypothetical protein
VAGFVIALANNEETEAFTATNCPSGNATQCAEDNQGSSSFLDTLRGINPFEFGDDAPAALVILWASVSVLLIIGAILLIVFSFIPLTSE